MSKHFKQPQTTEINPRFMASTWWASNVEFWKTFVALLVEHSPVPCTCAVEVRSFDDVEKVKQVGQGKVDDNWQRS